MDLTVVSAQELAPQTLRPDPFRNCLDALGGILGGPIIEGAMGLGIGILRACIKGLYEVGEGLIQGTWTPNYAEFWGLIWGLLSQLSVQAPLLGICTLLSGWFVCQKTRTAQPC